jgi:hypothetical protein
MRVTIYERDRETKVTETSRLLDREPFPNRPW